MRSCQSVKIYNLQRSPIHLPAPQSPMAFYSASKKAITLHIVTFQVIISGSLVQKLYNIIVFKPSLPKMSEYLDNFEDQSLFGFAIPHQPQESQFLSIHSYNSLQSPQCLSRAQQMQINKKELPTADQTQPALQIPPAMYLQDSRALQKGISYAKQVKDLNELVRLGSKDDTVELNINFKTIIFNHFKQLIQANELSPQQTQLVLHFGKRTPSFKSLLQLCDQYAGGREVARLCMKFLTSSLILRRILESRCKMSTKLQMIKFVEKLRSNIGCGRIVKWKAPTAK